MLQRGRITSGKSLQMLVVWILFKDVMSMHRTKATMIGLLDIGKVKE
jgi:beta-mannan synthase